MKAQDLLKLLTEQIPITNSLEVRVDSADFDKVVLKAPLQPNHNHMGTAFGGSISMLLILSGYTWLYNRMSDEAPSAHVILRKSDVDYLAPVDEDMTITCLAPSDKDFQQFAEHFRRKGRARIELEAIISTSKGVTSKMTGQFVLVS